MLNYIYDGSFEGLLTCIHEAFYRHEHPQCILPQIPTQASLLERNEKIETNQVKSMKVYNAVKEKISYNAQRQVYYSYLSELEDAGTWIYEYLKLGFKMGENVDLFLSDDRVLRILNTSRKVKGEQHRMLGLLRFKQVNEQLYYAQMTPDFNITGIIAPHFAQRLSDQNWIIHDLKRSCAAMFNKKKWVLTNMESSDISIKGEIELDYQNLWKLYFKTIAIPNRVNPKLQRSFMPQRYWEHLVETP